MGNHTYQTVAPVIVAECHLLARCVFQGAVGSEVDECVGTEAVACPEIGGYIGVGRRLVGAVHDLEGVASLACHHLGHERHVAKLQSCHGELAVVGRHILAGEVAIELAHLLHLFLAQGFAGPVFKLTGSNQSGMSCLHELGVGSLCIGAEHGSLCLDHLCQFLCIGGQIAHVVALALQTNQEVVERRHHLHARGCEGVLTGALEVEDGDALVAVLLLFEVHIALHACDEVVHAVGDAIHLLQSVLVLPVGEDGVGAHGSVYLGRDEALRHESAVHALLVVQPVFGEPVHVEGREEGDVLLLEEFHEVVAEPAVRHVHHGTGLDAVSVVGGDEALELVHAVYVEALFLESLGEVGGSSHEARDHHHGGVFLVEAVLHEEGVVFLHTVEAQLVALLVLGVEMGEETVGMLLHARRLHGEEFLAVDELADIGEHVAVVLLASVLDVLHQVVGVEVVHRHDVVGRVGGGMGQGGHLVGCLLQLLALRLVDAQSHTVHENHVVVGEMVEVIGGDFAELDHLVVVGVGDLSQGNGLVVEEGDARGAYPSAVSLADSSQGSQCEHRQEYVFSFYLFNLSYSYFHNHLLFRAAKLRLIWKSHNTDK